MIFVGCSLGASWGWSTVSGQGDPRLIGLYLTASPRIQKRLAFFGGYGPRSLPS
jgi:hypothetical protein